MKLPFWASVLTLAGAALLLKLGFWQMERMVWKADILARLEAAYDSDVAVDLLASGRGVGDLQAYERGFVDGEYLRVPPILVGPQVLEKKPGFHVYSPLRAGGMVLFVNRGWVPLEYKTHTTGESVGVFGAFRVTGLVRIPEKAGLFVAGNEPERELWRHPDPTLFARSLGILGPVSPAVFFAETEAASVVVGLNGTDIREPEFVPIPISMKPKLSNNHFQYGLFWFAMAGLLILFYLLRFHNTSVHKS